MRIYVEAGKETSQEEFSKTEGISSGRFNGAKTWRKMGRVWINGMEKNTEYSEQADRSWSAPHHTAF